MDSQEKGDGYLYTHRPIHVSPQALFYIGVPIDRYTSPLLIRAPFLDYPMFYLFRVKMLHYTHRLVNSWFPQQYYSR